jgi:hypothetical protein
MWWNSTCDADMTFYSYKFPGGLPGSAKEWGNKVTLQISYTNKELNQKDEYMYAGVYKPDPN